MFNKLMLVKDIGGPIFLYWNQTHKEKFTLTCHLKGCHMNFKNDAKC